MKIEYEFPINSLQDDFKEYSKALQVIDTRIAFDLMKRAYPREEPNDVITKNELFIFVENILGNIAMLTKCYSNLAEEQKNEIVKRAKVNDSSLSSYFFADFPHYETTPEQWLCKKGYTTKGTGYHKNTPKKGSSKAFYDLFKEIHNGNLLHFENLINEVKEMKKEK